MLILYLYQIKWNKQFFSVNFVLLWDRIIILVNLYMYLLTISHFLLISINTALIRRSRNASSCPFLFNYVIKHVNRGATWLWFLTYTFVFVQGRFCVWPRFCLLHSHPLYYMLISYWIYGNSFELIQYNLLIVVLISINLYIIIFCAG